MYETYFKFGQRPFAAAPQTDRYFPAAAIEHARQTLIRCVERAEGSGLIVGGSGTGKTLLCQLLADQFKDNFDTALLSSGRLCTRRALLQAILFEMGLPYRGMEEGELRLSLLDHLAPGKHARLGLVLLVDEAHSLPWRLMEELRMITNLVRDGQPRVRLILAGSPLLEERFASPKMDSFSQRLAARCYLETFDRDETFAYVRAQVGTVGGDPDELFSEEALQSVYRATDGVPRLINQVCDHALILASLGGHASLDGGVVEEAWADLQQLPTPWSAGRDEPVAGKVIEFGGLDEDDVLEAIPFRPAATDAVTARTEAALDRAQRQLSQLTDEFEPAGSIGPEVELVFVDSSNPFAERFQEEEVVLDRFVAADAELFSSRPTVASHEGRDLAAMLPAPSKGSAAEIRQVDAGDRTVKSNGAARAEASKEAARPIAASRAADDEDEDVLVIEDDAPSTVPVRQSPLVRRQEYRQLFAKLRRG